MSAFDLHKFIEVKERVCKEAGGEVSLNYQLIFNGIVGDLSIVFHAHLIENSRPISTDGFYTQT